MQGQILLTHGGPGEADARLADVVHVAVLPNEDVTEDELRPVTRALITHYERVKVMEKGASTSSDFFSRETTLGGTLGGKEHRSRPEVLCRVNKKKKEIKPTIIGNAASTQSPALRPS